MSPKTIIDGTIKNLETLGATSAVAFVKKHREDVLREIGIAKSNDGTGTRSGVDFGTASLAKVKAKLVPEGKDAAKAFGLQWAVFAATWAQVVAMDAAE